MMLRFTVIDTLFGQSCYVLSNSVSCPIDLPIVLSFPELQTCFDCNLILFFNFPSFNFLRLYLSVSIFLTAYLLTASLSLIFETTK
jgi:hypothetical protein